MRHSSRPAAIDVEAAALREAYLQLSGSNALVKHVILLSDGQSPESGVDALLGDMRELGATAPQLHAALAAPLSDAKIDILFCCGHVIEGLFATVPAAMRGHPRLLPLSFGIDNEIWHGVTAHTGLPADCQVPGRALPSGLDLLVGLGSDEAQGILSAEYFLGVWHPQFVVIFVDDARRPIKRATTDE